MRQEQQAASQRIGVYGGTFDPVHLGHLRVAASIQARFGLQRVLFVPAFVPPHKRDRQISAAWHRYAMLVLATADEPSWQVSTIELDAPTRPYTIETLDQLQAQMPTAQLFFVMGMDSFRDLPLWRAHETLLTRYSIIVAARPGYRADDAPMVTGSAATNLTTEIAPVRIALGAHLAPAVQARVIDLRDQQNPTAQQLATPHTYVTDYVTIDLSATAIRQTAQAGASISPYVPETVARYVAKYALYQ